MQRIMIVGPGGAGKSSLARRLGGVLDLPVYHLDVLFWRPGWMPMPRDEWIRLQSELVATRSWIIDGNYGATLDIRLAAADTVLFLDFPRWLTLVRVVKRRIQYHRRTRPDMHTGCPEKLDWEFIHWIWRFPRVERPRMLEKLRQSPSPSPKVIILRTSCEVRAWVKGIQRNAVSRSSPTEG